MLGAGPHSAFCIFLSANPVVIARRTTEHRASVEPMRSGLILAMSFTAAVGTAQVQSPSFVSTSAELVVLPVAVADKHGNFVPDLPRDRFTVYDNGRRQQVALFSNEDTAVTVGLVIDSSGSMGPKLPEVIIATLTFARRSNPQDELFTVAFNDTVRDPGTERSAAASDMPALESELRSFRPQGRTALYDGLIAALDRVERGTRPRKALILISDGGDNASRSTLNDVLGRARRSNVTIFTVGLFDRDDPDRNPGVLKSLAQSTGGERFLPPPESPAALVRACERIARELRTGYTIGYVPPDRDGVYHRVRVEVAQTDNRGKLEARTRPGYFAAVSTTDRHE
jgi:Ca-activated chloride channel family protein